MLKRPWIVSTIAISGLLSGCTRHAGTLAENDPFQGKDPFQVVASQESASGNSQAGTVNQIPPPTTANWNTADGWRTASYVTHPEYVYDPMSPPGANRQPAQVVISDRTNTTSRVSKSSVQNAGYFVSSPVSTEAHVEVLNPDKLERNAQPKFSVHDGIRFIDTTSKLREHPSFAGDDQVANPGLEVPPFVEESNNSSSQIRFEANPFEAESPAATSPGRTPAQNAPEWWKS